MRPASIYLRLVARLKSLQDKILAPLSSRLLEVEGRLLLLDQAEQRLVERALRLEKLLTGTAAARLPGAAKAVEALGSPVVSVVMPTHNRASFVGEAIRSVIEQRFTDWELVVVDDGSVDDTRTAVAPYLADPRIRYVWQENAGAGAARNVGVAATRAPLLAYLDDDNLWYPDFLLRATDLFAVSPEVDFAYAALVSDLFEHGRRIMWEPFNRQALTVANFIDTNVIVHRRELFEKYGYWREDPNVAASDWDLALRMTRDKDGYPLDVLGAYYRQCDEHRLSRRFLNVE
ncbi:MULTISPECIES: glycosyltransferase family A protein [unclassified Devosia]|uniref:glycosyltransferase family 2 protein n=1 Tax=unclassified Devosia TaxID=196773 RepID=UPI001ACA2D37|nr:MULTISPECIES: glycosyltransferase family A protein [unclassified Devosia]MBN9307630.1 glycosyltransferase family 2 protein [Devosia sp.]